MSARGRRDQLDCDVGPLIRRRLLCVVDHEHIDLVLFGFELAGQQVGVRQVSERVWLVTFMHYDLGYFDDETCRLEPIENPFGPTVLPMCPE
jgi:hypothetical protein